jgi:hypothetical protein
MPAPYYTKAIGEVQLFVLDASDPSRVRDEGQTAWLARELETSSAPWKIAVVHSPAYSCGRSRGSRDVLEQWVPLFERYGVRLVLSAHDRNYQRFEERGGVTYVVEGAGDSHADELVPCPASYPRRLAASTEQGFLYLVATQDELEATAVNADRKRLDRFVLRAGPAYEAGGDVGYEDRSFAGSRHSPTGAMTESKLWYHDGFWWGSLFDPASGGHHVFRLDSETQRWVDTGTTIDDRPDSRADALWDGNKLYVASHVVNQIAKSGFASRLYRFSYAPKQQRFVLDPGFPETINATSSETLVIDQDSTGRVWATWVQGGRVYVNRTLEGDTRWGTPFVLPAEGVDVGPDISSVVAFGGDRIGVFWGNHKTGRFYFAVHRDSSPDDVWEPSEVISEPGSAADHLNVKTDSSGRIYAVVKTRAENATAPLVILLIRNPDTANWTSHTVGTVANRHSRPIVMVDERQGAVYVIASAPLDPEQEAQVVMKAAPIDGPVFDGGIGVPIIRDVKAPDISNPSSTKQVVSIETGLVVLASNNLTGRYWHSFDSLATSPFVIAADEQAGVAPVTTMPVENDGSMSLRDMVSRASPAMLVAFGLPLWLLVIAAVGGSRRLAISGVSGLLVVTCAVGLTIGLASLLL